TVVSGSVEPDTFKLRRRGHEEVELDSVVVGAHQKSYERQINAIILTLLRLKALQVLQRYRMGNFQRSNYILQSRPVTNIAPETDYEMKHEFDIPLRCETEYFSVANLGEILFLLYACKCIPL
ncbi:putative phosphoenolpyruvate synthase, partial [Trichonephila inaurata madagascariensis]